jgi:phytoene synthase
MSTKLQVSPGQFDPPQPTPARAAVELQSGRDSIDSTMTTHARTFSFAARFLPHEKRIATTVLYAFCREVDDLVDEPAPGRTESDVRNELDAWRSWLSGPRTAAGPREPLASQLAEVIERYAIPIRYLLDLLAGLESDIGPRALEDEAELHRYCYQVASTVGLGMAHILGATSDAALQAAADLGAAMQLTNILRDVGEDVSLCRFYLPKKSLVPYRLDHDDLKKLWQSGHGPDDRFRALMRTEISRARDLYQQGMPGIWLLPTDSRLPILLASRLYRRILTVIERRDYDTLRRRASTSRLEKVEEAAIVLLVDRLWRRGEDGERPCSATPSTLLREI